MKTLLLLLAFAFSISSITFSCKKKDAEKTTAQKLQNKWTFIDIIDNDHYAGADHVITLKANAGDYLDFRTNNKVYSRFQSQPDTSDYKLLGDTKVVFDNYDTLTIQTLTDNTLKMYAKDVTSTTIYEEFTYNLNR